MQAKDAPPANAGEMFKTSLAREYAASTICCRRLDAHACNSNHDDDALFNACLAAWEVDRSTLNVEVSRHPLYVFFATARDVAGASRQNILYLLDALAHAFGTCNALSQKTVDDMLFDAETGECAQCAKRDLASLWRGSVEALQESLPRFANARGLLRSLFFQVGRMDIFVEMCSSPLRLYAEDAVDGVLRHCGEVVEPVAVVVPSLHAAKAFAVFLLLLGYPADHVFVSEHASDDAYADMVAYSQQLNTTTATFRPVLLLNYPRHSVGCDFAAIRIVRLLAVPPGVDQPVCLCILFKKSKGSD